MDNKNLKNFISEINRFISHPTVKCLRIDCHDENEKDLVRMIVLNSFNIGTETLKVIDDRVITNQDSSKFFILELK